jgi:hypothetical protein
MNVPEPHNLAWQWSLYHRGHRNRTNLLIHLLTVPCFIAGTGALLLAPFAAVVWLPCAGLAGLLLAIVAQGRGHRMEKVAPVPFDGPLDVARRLLSEQLFTFPRFVLTGGFAKAWRGKE